MERPERMTDAEWQRFRKVMAESAKRQGEALNLYRPLTNVAPFHECKKRIRLIVSGNRGGKTTASAVEMSRAFLGKDPFEKYPKRNGVFFVFGIDAKHIGNVLYKKLFRAGAFKMIRDPKSFLWRSFDPVADAALALESKAKVIPAPPLIPPRFIDWIVWDKKRAGIPSCVVLKNGTEIHFFSIEAEMPRGMDIDGAWIDEEAVKEGIIAEIMARLVDRGGRLVWSATPQSGGDQLFDLMESAGSIDVDLFHAHIWDNTHIAEEEKDAFFRRLSEDERRVRWYGEPMLSGFTVYPEFSRVVHSFPEGRGWQPPDDWARYISVDPGRQVCYVSFLTVPPPWVGNFVVIHDELHLEKCDAKMFGKELGLKSQHGVTYEAALIDGNQCRVSDMGSGKSIEDQYRNAMFEHGVRVRTGGFTWGADDVAPGIEAVHTWLRIGSNGFPYMRVLVENCPWLCREMLKYRYVKDQHGMPSNKVLKKNDHSTDTLRYLAMLSPKWVRPLARIKKDKFSSYENFLVRKKAKDARRGGGGPGGVIKFGMGTQ